MILENFAKILFYKHGFQLRSAQPRLGCLFVYFTCFVGIATAEETEIKIRQNSIASIFDVILVVSLLEIFSVRGVVITKFECI